MRYQIGWFLNNTHVGVYIKRVAIAFSVLLNVLLGGESNQTLSARNWHLKRERKLNFVVFIDALFIDRNHCLTSWAYWRVRKDVSWSIEHSRATLEQLEYERNQPDNILRRHK